jgi:hypothetical protein
VVVPAPALEGEEEPPKEREPLNGKEAREMLLKKIGPDYLVDKFLEQKFEALTEAERSAVEKAIEQFRSDELVERDAGEEAIRKVGPRSAPLLKGLLASEDGEVRQRARALLGAWAEPK